LTVVAAILSDSVGFLQLVSGTILVRSVLRINRFFKERGAEGYINTGMLLRHATAFGLYLACTAINYASYTLYLIFPTDRCFNIFMLASMVWMLGGFFS
jgi:hypothetical protein